MKKLKVYHTNWVTTTTRPATIPSIEGDVYVRLEQVKGGVNILACDSTGAMVVGGVLATMSPQGITPAISGMIINTRTIVKKSVRKKPIKKKGGARNAKPQRKLQPKRGKARG